MKNSLKYLFTSRHQTTINIVNAHSQKMRGCLEDRGAGKQEAYFLPSIMRVFFNLAL